MFIAAGFRIAKGENKKCPPMDKWINKLWYIHNEILFSHKKESSTDNVTTQMNLENIVVGGGGELVMKDYILCGSIYMKYKEKLNPQRLKEDWWLPGPGTKEKW